MIIPFVFTLDTVADGRQLTWVFNKAVSFSKEYGWPVIAQKQYYDHYLEDASASGAEYFDYDVPQPVFLKKITSVVIPEELEKNFIKNAIGFRYLWRVDIGKSCLFYWQWNIFCVCARSSKSYE